MYELNEAFVESPLPFRVDIVDWASTTKEFKKIIQNQWIKIG